MHRSHALILCCVLLAGCKLVDQRTFDRNAGRPPVPPPPPAASGPEPIPPLYVVHAGLPPEDWKPDLRDAARDALARKPNVLFTVESVAPPSPSPAAQAASLQATTAELGRPVAEALAGDGAPRAQIEMTAAIDPRASAPEVRIYVH
jgi:hypothetical protein